MTSIGAPAAATAGDVGDWRFPGGGLRLDRPRVVGILNLTPDSFSDGGELTTPAAAAERARRLVAEGADVLDLGAESTRPGAQPVPPARQLDRLLPVLERLGGAVGVPISVDTRSAAVAEHVLAAGAAIVNDVSGLADPAMARVVRDAGAGLVLMHMRGTPETMQSLAEYDDVVDEVRAELGRTLDVARAAGIPAEHIVLDPGIGFAKRGEHSLALLGGLDRLRVLGRPLLVGTSRKSFLGPLLGGAGPRERLPGTLASCVAALLHGARLFRVHDVAAVRQALDVAEAIRRAATLPAIP